LQEKRRAAHNPHNGARKIAHWGKARHGAEAYDEAQREGKKQRQRKKLYCGAKAFQQGESDGPEHFSTSLTTGYMA
jgi:hypothetical protein